MADDQTPTPAPAPDAGFSYDAKVRVTASPASIEAGSALLVNAMGLVERVIRARVDAMAAKSARYAAQAEAEAARMTAEGTAETPAPLAPAPEPVAAAPVAEYPDALIDAGRQAFGRLVTAWASNFGVLDAPQPDRTSLLVACFSGYRLATLAYIRSMGGLATACIDALLLGGMVAPDGANLLGRQIALNMVQVSGSVGMHLDRLLEAGFYQSIDNPHVAPEDRDAVLLATPLGGGIAEKIIDFDTDAPALRSN